MKLDIYQVDAFTSEPFHGKPAAIDCDVPAGLIEALGAEPQRVLKSRDYLAMYGSEAEVLSLKPDFRAISDLGVHAVIVTAQGDSSDFASRFFAPSVGVDEDP